jgi:hypothetical protein
MQFNTLRLEDIVVHRVPGRGDAGAVGPLLSEAQSPRDARVFSFFRQRLSGVMARKGLPVEPDPAALATDAAVGTVMSAARDIIGHAGNLVTASQTIAQRLWDTQDRRNPAGILVVARGSIDDLACAGILKLEHERGVQAEQETNDQGQLVFRVILHDDLLLTDRTAVFKGVIVRVAGANDNSFVSEASDLQNVRDVAGFFLRRFLGCKLVDDPAEATRKYFEAAEEFVNSEVLEPEKRARYEGALLAQMNSAVQTVDPDRFARENFDADEHQPFLDHLAERGASTRSFTKDTVRIQGRIRRVSYGFRSGIRLVGQLEAMEEHVEIETDQAVGTKVTITDEITRMKGAG